MKIGDGKGVCGIYHGLHRRRIERDNRVEWDLELQTISQKYLECSNIVHIYL